MAGLEGARESNSLSMYSLGQENLVYGITVGRKVGLKGHNMKIDCSMWSQGQAWLVDKVTVRRTVNGVTGGEGLGDKVIERIIIGLYVHRGKSI